MTSNHAGVPELLRLAFSLTAGLVLGGCAPLVGAEFDGLQPSADAGTAANGAVSPDPEGTEEGAPPAIEPVPDPIEPDATGACPSGTKKCDRLCVSPMDPKFGCGETCGAPCVVPKNGAALCRDDACAVACNTGLSECSPGVCAASTTFYGDQDGDGWGSAEVVHACAPAPGLATKTGDCHDGNANVFPGQSLYFAVPYPTPTGASSFDYDCSGNTEPDPQLIAFQSYPLCGNQACNASTSGDYCWELQFSFASGPSGFQKCGARAWTCLDPAGWNPVTVSERLKSYPCH